MALQDSDNFIIGRGTDSYKITYQDLKDDLNYVPPPELELTVSKGSISPSVDVEEGDTLIGSANVTDAENPVEVHVWELDGVEAQRGSANTYVADAGSVRYRQEVTDDNNDSPVIGEWSNAVNVAEYVDPTKPNATMYGLRFDNERRTLLKRDAQSPNLASTWSVWFKHTDTTRDQTIFDLSLNNNPDGAGDTGFLRLGTGGTNGIGYHYKSEAKGIDNYNVVADVLTENRWQHIVFSVEGSTINVYVDGTSVLSENLGAIDVDFPYLAIGGNVLQNSPNLVSGYLSDAYFVEGQTLGPTAFGKSFEGKWGPLDSSDVLKNIAGGVESPSDSAPNYAEKWSSGSVTGGFQRPIENLFDGDTTTGTWADSSAGFELTFPSAISVSESITLIGGSDSNNFRAVVDGAEVPFDFQPTGANGFEQVVTVSASGSFTAIKSTNQNGELHGIRADGRLLIDGPANTSQVWSEGTSNQNIFDGDEDTFKTLTGFPVTATNQSFVINSSLEILSNDGSGASVAIINGVNCATTLDAGSELKWRSCDLSGLSLPVTVTKL